MKKADKFVKRCKIIGYAAIAGTIAFLAFMSSGASDPAIRSKIVRLHGSAGYCSGEQVQAPSGVSYIITAGHCRAVGPEITAITEDGKQLVRHIIAEDPNSDLLLLEGLPGVEGLKVASHSEIRQHVRTFTHGRNYDTYKTEGVLVQSKHIDIPDSRADTPELEAACTKMPKYHVETFDSFFFGPQKVCVLSFDAVAMTAQVEPGSSGGAILDDAGDLIGVVSASGEGFGWEVPLKALKTFLANY